MSGATFYIGPTSCTDLVRGMEAIWKDLGSNAADQLAVSVAGVQMAAGAPSVVVSAGDVQRLSALAALPRPTTGVLTLAGRAGATVQFHAEDGPKQERITIARPNNLPAGAYLDILGSAQKHFPPIAALGARSGALGVEMAEFYKHREATLARLEQVHADTVVEAARLRSKLIEEHEALQQSLRAQHDEEARRLRAEVAAKEAELAERERQLDASDARHARRKNQQAIKQLLQNRSQSFELTEATKAKRNPIIHACYLAGAVSLVTFATLISASLLGAKLDLSAQVARAVSAVTAQPG